MIQTEEIAITYTCDGTQKEFPYPYPYRSGEDVTGYIVNELEYEQEIKTNYKYDTVENKYTYPVEGEALGKPYKIKLIRETPQQQNTSLPNRVPFSSIEKALDWIIMILQEVGSKINNLWDVKSDCKKAESNANDYATAAAQSALESILNAANSKASADLAAKYAEEAAQSTGIVDFEGATAAADGARGLVPAPQKGDNENYLCGDGTFKRPIPAGGTADAFLRGDGTWGQAMPEGTVLHYAGTEAPAGWLVCDGSEVSKEKYRLLYQIIGTTYGTATDSDKFVLPNLINRFIEGSKTTGTAHEAGLPNITGWATILPTGKNMTDNNSGALYGSNFTEGLNAKGLSAGTLWGNDMFGKADINIDASRSNSIYGNSDTVQPPSLTLLPIIKATAQDEQHVTIKVKQTANQTVSVTVDGVAHTDSFTAEKGKTYTASVTADEGYTAGTITVTDA